MSSFQDYNIFNTVNQDALSPKARKPLPFPLENIDKDIADIYTSLHSVTTKLVAAKENPINQTPAKQKRLKNLIYKVKTSMKFLKEVSDKTQELWF